MADICHGDWIESTINGQDDGTIQVNQGAGGLLSGKHLKSDKEISGVCMEQREPHRMLIVRFENGSTFVYQGEIEERSIPRPHFKIVNGFVLSESPGVAESRRVDDWTAEKPT